MSETCPTCGQTILKDATSPDPRGASVKCAFCPRTASFCIFKTPTCFVHREWPVRLARGEKDVKVCDKHPRAVWHDAAECPACRAEDSFLALTKDMEKR
jgi:hypothetical protein